MDIEYYQCKKCNTATSSNAIWISVQRKRINASIYRCCTDIWLTNLNFLNINTRENKIDRSHIVITYYFAVKKKSFPKPIYQRMAEHVTNS